MYYSIFVILCYVMLNLLVSILHIEYIIVPSCLSRGYNVMKSVITWLHMVYAYLRHDEHPLNDVRSDGVRLLYASSISTKNYTSIELLTVAFEYLCSYNFDHNSWFHGCYKTQNGYAHRNLHKVVSDWFSLNYFVYSMYQYRIIFTHHLCCYHCW